MKKLTILVVLALLLVGATAVWAASVTPVEVDNLGIGDAGFYCVSELDYDFGLKIEALGDDPPAGDYPKPNQDRVYDGKGSFVDDFVNTITISNANRYQFDWASDPYAIGAVVVQGGPLDNIFYYDPAEDSDIELYAAPKAPIGPGKGAAPSLISHISFCWNKTDDNGDDECYQEETAWAAGDPYNPDDGGNWAMYVAYYGEELTVDLIAGQNLVAGTVTFSEVSDGKVDITIDLAEEWFFYYDLADIEEDDNIKIQDYDEAPTGNPAIGLFDWKAFVPIGETTYTITVPENNFYGVHVDLAHMVECE